MRLFTLSLLAMSTLALSGCFDSAMRMVGLGGDDPIQQQIDTMASTPMVPYFVNFHKNPEVGQWAKYKGYAGEEWYGIVGGESDAWLVEKRYAPLAMQGNKDQVSLILKVNDKGSVSQAWAGKYDPKAEEMAEAIEVKIMAKPAPTDATASAGEAPKPKWTKGKAAGLDCDVMELDKSKMWYSKEAYFSWMLDIDKPMEKGGIVKSQYDGKVTTEMLKQGKEELNIGVKLPG